MRNIIPNFIGNGCPIAPAAPNAVDSWLNDPFAKSLIKTLGLADEQEKGIAASVISIKLKGGK